MSKKLNVRVYQKHDTPENWAKAINFVPAAGEMIIYDGNPSKLKIGDGKTKVNDLPFTEFSGPIGPTGPQGPQGPVGPTGPNNVIDKNPTLTWSTKSTVASINGTDIHVTMPANPDTNTSHNHTAGTGLNITGSGGTSGTTTYSVKYGTIAGTACEGNDARLSDARPANGGNADTVDNKHASDFAAAQHNHDDRYYTESEADNKFGQNAWTWGVGSDTVGTSGWYQFLQVKGEDVGFFGNLNLILAVTAGYTAQAAGILNLQVRVDANLPTIWNMNWLSRDKGYETSWIKASINEDRTLLSFYAFNPSNQFGRIFFHTLQCGSTNGAYVNLSKFIVKSTTPTASFTPIKEATDVFTSVAYSGSYNDLTNKPTIPSIPNITVNDSGSGTYVTDVTSSGHTLTLTRGTPSIPTVNNPTITIKQNGTSKGSFTLNQSGAATIELTDNNTTYSNATSSSAGLMSAADKAKLDDYQDIIPSSGNTNTDSWLIQYYNQQGKLAFNLDIAPIRDKINDVKSYVDTVAKDNVSETTYASRTSITLEGLCGFILITPSSSSSSTVTLSSLNSPTSVSISAYGTTQKIMIYYTLDTASGYYFLSGTYYNTSNTSIYHIQARTDATFSISSGCSSRIIKISD